MQVGAVVGARSSGQVSTLCPLRDQQHIAAGPGAQLAQHSGLPMPGWAQTPCSGPATRAGRAETATETPGWAAPSRRSGRHALGQRARQAGAWSASVAPAHSTARRQSTMRMSAASRVAPADAASAAAGRSAAGAPGACGVVARGRSWPAPIMGWRTTHTTAPTAKITPHHTMSERSQPNGSAPGAGLVGLKSMDCLPGS